MNMHLLKHRVTVNLPPTPQAFHLERERASERESARRAQAGPCLCEVSHRGPSLKRKRTPLDPTVGICLGSWGGFRVVSVFLSARYPCRNSALLRWACHHPAGFAELCLSLSLSFALTLTLSDIRASSHAHALCHSRPLTLTLSHTLVLSHALFLWTRAFSHSRSL